MKYSDIIGIKSDYRDVFDMIDEGKNDWKQFVSNVIFEENLKKILDCFTSPNSNKRKSIWIEGTYGTGKSHSTSVVKHLFSDNIDDIKDFISEIGDSQLRAELTSFRENARIFPVVLKGISGVDSATNLKIVIQKAVTDEMKKRGIECVVPGECQRLKEQLQKPEWSGILESLLKNDFAEYGYSKEDLFQRLDANDTTVLSTIVNRLEASNLATFSEDIETWLKAIRENLKKSGVADYLVIFWDEFTPLLDQQDRRAIMSYIQNIAELTSQHGVYLFLVNHINLEASDVFNSLSEKDQRLLRDRFLILGYEIHYDTTYQILLKSLNRKDPDEIDKLTEERVSRNFEVNSCIDLIANGSENKVDAASNLKRLYPLHPYTSYCATFLSRTVGSSERSIFNFLADSSIGFVKFLDNEVETSKFVTIDYLWDFFEKNFRDEPKYSDVINCYRRNIDSMSAAGQTVFAVFKSILLLNILQSTASTSTHSEERNLTAPSKDNILMAFSGEYDHSDVEAALKKISDDNVIYDSPNHNFTIAVSSVPAEKVTKEKEIQAAKYPTADTMMDLLYTSYRDILKREIIKKACVRRPFSVVFLSPSYKEANITERLNTEIELHPGFVIVAVFLWMGFDPKNGEKERDTNEMQTLCFDLSQKKEYKTVVFLLVKDAPFGKNRYGSWTEAIARQKIAADSGATTDRDQYTKAASDWFGQFETDVLNSTQSILIYSNTTSPIAFKNVAQFVCDKIIKVTFNCGLDMLTPLATTVWIAVSKPKTKGFEKMLNNSFEANSNVHEIPALNKLLYDEQNNQIFDSKMNILDSMKNSNTPVVKLCHEVSKIMDQHTKDTSVDLTELFGWIFKPPYGYMMTDSSMAAVALAFRPYMNKIFTAQTVSPIGLPEMRTLLSDLFSFFLIPGTAKSSFLTIRFSTQESIELGQKLVDAFHLTDCDDSNIIDIKWKIREKIKNENKAPLWVLKYKTKGKENNGALYDGLFAFSYTSTEEINDEAIKTLLKLVENRVVDISADLAQVGTDNLMVSFVAEELGASNADDLSTDECINFLKNRLSGDLVFWDEEQVRTAIKDFVIDKRSEKQPDISPVPGTPISPKPVETDPEERKKKLAALREALYNQQMNNDSLKNAVMTMGEKFPGIIDALLEALTKQNQ